LVERRETFVAYVYRGYWIDIGTPEKYVQVHRDIMDHRFSAPPFEGAPLDMKQVSPGARIEDGATIEGPCFIDDGVIVKPGARIAPYSVLGKQCHIEEDAQVDASIVWANTRIGRDSQVRNSILGRHCHVGRNSILDGGIVLGDKSVVTDYSRL
jgi:NDP-sugar pyrophosphorylase family protein